jgi:2-methylisocitrate lyase-like PEP mutase family enzyme
MTFKELHLANEPLLLCNVWDVASAKLAEKLQFKALGTSSAAIAHSMGFEDGEQMAFADVYRCVKQITANTSLPLSVDMEAGYSDDPLEVASYLKALAMIGVQGINIEDSKVIKDRRLVKTQDFAEFLGTIIKQLRKQSINLFINTRTDVFLLGHADPVAEASLRIKAYQEAGADGVFVPGIVNESHIKTLVGVSPLPLNVMCMPALADFSSLSTLGVKRISMGNFLYENMQQHLAMKLNEIITAQSFDQVF